MKFLTNWKVFEDRRKLKFAPGNFTDRDVEIIEDLFQEYVDKYQMVEYGLTEEDQIIMDEEGGQIIYDVGKAYNAFIDIHIPDKGMDHLIDNIEKLEEIYDDMKTRLIPRLKKFGYDVVSYTNKDMEINLVLGKNETFNESLNLTEVTQRELDNILSLLESELIDIMDIDEVQWDGYDPKMSIIRHARGGAHGVIDIHNSMICIKPVKVYNEDRIEICIIYNNILSGQNASRRYNSFTQKTEAKMRSFYRRIVKWGWCKNGNLIISNVPSGGNARLTSIEMSLKRLVSKGQNG